MSSSGPKQSLSTPSLAQRLARGDHSALDEIIDLHYDRCLSVARGFTSRDDAFCRDATQTAMLKLVRNPPRLSSDEHLARWLASSIRSACIDQFRREASQRRREQNSSPQSARATDAALIEHLRRALNQLSDQERSMLVQRFARDRTLAGMAEDLGVSRDSVKSRLTRTLTRLRTVLQPDTPKTNAEHTP